MTGFFFPLNFTATAAVIVALLGAVQTPLSSADTGQLVVELSGLKDPTGTAVVELWQGDEHWLDKDFPGAVVRSGSSVVDTHSAQITFEDLPFGEYAITAYHDRNSNGELDTGFLRMPKERVGFSNNVRPRLRAPTYEDCLVRFSPAARYVSIEVRKLP